jgi:exonuclease III
MARLFSFASWNIERFRGRQERFDRVVDVLSDNGPPDVFGIFEVQSSTHVFNEFTTRIPTHQFFITVTANSPIDTLIGVNRNFTAYYEQRDELTAGMPSLRPGALVTLVINNQNFTLLFLHLKAFDTPVAWGLRDDMIGHVRNLKRRLDNIASADANFIALGDYNAVGLTVTYADNDMDDSEELSRYEKVLGYRNLRLVPKDRNHTLWNGPGSSQPPADADHVFASEHLDIRPDNQGSGVSVKGWPELQNDAEKGQWISELSDHAMIYGEVHS